MDKKGRLKASFLWLRHFCLELFEVFNGIILIQEQAGK